MVMFYKQNFNFLKPTTWYNSCLHTDTQACTPPTKEAPMATVSGGQIFRTNEAENPCKIMAVRARHLCGGGGLAQPAQPSQPLSLSPPQVISTQRPPPPSHLQFCRLRWNPGLQPRGQRSSLQPVWGRGCAGSGLGWARTIRSSCVARYHQWEPHQFSSLSNGTV